VHIDPTDENVQALLRRDLEGPVVVLDLLRLREVADYSRLVPLVATTLA
jgi:ribosomal protein S28E/S33